MTLNLPDIGMTEAELRRELAAMLFQKNKLTMAQAAQLSGESEIEFQQRLGIRPVRRVTRRPTSADYTVADFQEDLRTLKTLGRL